MMILFYRPFDVDDLVEAGGAFGTVNRMTLVSTTIPFPQRDVYLDSHDPIVA